MENRRIILLAMLGVVLFFMYQAWEKDYGPSPVRHTEDVAAAIDDAPSQDTATEPDDVPKIAPASEQAPARVPGSGSAEATPEQAVAGQSITVDTDVMRATISTTGGELRRVELKRYPVSKKHPDVPLALLDDRGDHYFVLQSGLAGHDKPLVTHRSVFSTAQRQYTLAEGQDSVEVVLHYQDPAGYRATKTYRFKRGSYKVELIDALDNGTAAPLEASPYARFVRTQFTTGDEPRFSHTFTGVGFYEQKEPDSDSYRFKKTALKKLDKDAYQTRQQGGWITMLQHYFVAAILPPQDQLATFSAKPSRNDSFTAQYVGARKTVAPGQSADFPTELYLGPKLQDRVADVAPGFDLTLDYGILTPISEPLFWLLSHFHKLTGNWGVSIILLTLLVKGIMYKLSEKQYRSMAKMKKFGPRMQEMRERYGDDREKMQKAMMELYKKEGFNPLAGCWPLLVQFPVFIALYWVFLESVELRQASFAFWLNDLTAPDPYYVLPVLFGTSMFLQQKLSGQQSMDPTQQKIMQVMPIMMTAFFAFFQSGLVLYWFVSNLIGLSQQWFITRKLEREETQRAAVKR